MHDTESKPDPASLGTPRDLTFDATTWAREFLRVVQANPQIATDEAALVCWFANAIMCGYDEAQKRQVGTPRAAREEQDDMNLSSGPIPLNEAQERAAKEWAADDRLWTTQETVEINLRTFARVVLKSAATASSPALPADVGALAVTCENGRHVWTPDFAYGDTCVCGMLYLHCRDDGSIEVAE